MFTVLIADDEYQVREQIRSAIDWTLLNMAILWEAGSGEEALRIIREMRPDIAILDIGMPDPDGMEIARIVDEDHLPTRIVFLTGRRSFQNAYRAIQYHAAAYILKPVEGERLYPALQDTVKQVRLRRLEIQQGQYDPFWEQDTLFQAYTAHLKDGVPDDFRAAKRAFLDRPYYASMLVFEGNKDYSRDRRYAAEMLETALAFFENEHEAAGFVMDEDRCAALFIAGDCTGEQVTAACEGVIRHLRTGKNCQAAAGISTLHAQMESVSDSLREARRALSHRFCRKNTDKAVYLWNRNMEKKDRQGRAVMQDILRHLETSAVQNQIRTEEGLDSYLVMLRSCELTEDTAKMILLRLLTVMIDFGQGTDPGFLFNHYSAAIMNCDHFEEAAALCAQWLRLQKLRVGNTFSELVIKTRNYIRLHYQETDLTLVRISESMFVSSSYLSSLFRKETGMSVTDFILECRMRKAARLIEKAQDYTLAVIAEQCGYNDPYYFSRSFKKYYGISPARYKDNSGLKTDEGT